MQNMHYEDKNLVPTFSCYLSKGKVQQLFTERFSLETTVDRNQLFRQGETTRPVSFYCGHILEGFRQLQCVVLFYVCYQRQTYPDLFHRRLYAQLDSVLYTRSASRLHSSNAFLLRCSKTVICDSWRSRAEFCNWISRSFQERKSMVKNIVQYS